MYSILYAYLLLLTQWLKQFIFHGKYIQQRRYGDIITHKLFRYKLCHVFLEARVNVLQLVEEIELNFA